jgi:hypothetical protein
MTDKPQESEDRDDRDRERSDEAHWRVAEEGAEDQDDEPKQQTTKTGSLIPVPNRGDFFANLKKIARPARPRKPR